MSERDSDTGRVQGHRWRAQEWNRGISEVHQGSAGLPEFGPHDARFTHATEG